MARCVTVDHGKATQPRQRGFCERRLTHPRILPRKQANHTAQIRLAMPARGVQAHQLVGQRRQRAGAVGFPRQFDGVVQVFQQSGNISQKSRFIRGNKQITG